MASIDDLDFDDEKELNTRILNVCFPICCLSESNTIIDSGTGFIINKNGLFLSAGHVFQKNISNYKAYYNNNEYAINIIHCEYNKNKGEDLFIGELVGFEEELSFRIELTNPNLINNNSELYSAGFNSIKSHFAEKGDTGYLIECNGTPYYGHVLSFKLVELKDKPIARHQDKRLHLSNMRILSIATTPTYRGLSGGPVFLDNKVFGVFLADVFVTSDYIQGILKIYID